MPLVSYALIDSITQGRGDFWFEPVRDACAAWEINTEHRVAMFVANTAHESTRYRRMVESLNYSAKRLAEVWVDRFGDEVPDPNNTRRTIVVPNAKALAIAGDEFAIGEAVYGGRMGNGPEGSGDGFKFRGRGLIQITGRNNYVLIGGLVYDRDDPWALLNEPDILTVPTWAAFASAAWWDSNGCNKAADDDDFEGVVRIIQTGNRHSTSRINGMGARLALLQEVQEAL